MLYIDWNYKERKKIKKMIFFVLTFPCEEVLNAPGQTSLRNERRKEKLTEILKPRKPAFEVYKFETF